MDLVTLDEPVDLVDFYRTLLAGNPGQPAIIAPLASALLGADEAEAALEVIETADEPDDAVLILARAQALKVLCRFEPAAEAFMAAIAHGAVGAGVLIALGICLAEAGRLDEAVVWFERAAPTDSSALALTNLGAVHARLGHKPEAIAACHAALHRDSGMIDAHRTLAVLLAETEPEAATRHRKAAFSRYQVITHKGPPGAPRVLVLTCVAAASVPIQHLLPKSRYELAEWFIDHAADDTPNVPSHDVVFNAIGEADLMPPVVPSVRRVLEAGRPVLNPPGSIAGSGRAALPDLLAGIDGVVVPPIFRLSAEEPISKFDLPVLVRPIGSHGGEGLRCVETIEGVKEAVLTAGEIHATSFVDYRSPDGFYRKYRMIFVDRVVYPYHLAIGPQWMVHYWTAGMETDPNRRTEEARFLADPVAAIGRTALAAIDTIARRLDLDYGGIDFSLLPDGRVLVFEANAAMLVHPEHDPVFTYKNLHVQRILDAFAAMLHRRVRCSRASA